MNWSRRSRGFRSGSPARLEQPKIARARTGTHDTYGVLDVAALLRLAIDHDREHLASVTA
jgi:hypothetical protein